MSILTVIQADGGNAAPDARQGQLLQAARQVIEASPEFTALTPANQTAPKLSQAEVNAGLSETQKGYLYLRYDMPGATPQEFWAHVGPATKLSWKSGQVSVTLPEAAAQAAATPAAT